MIPLEQFNAVQDEIQRRAEKHYTPHRNKGKYPFSGLLVCANCGKHYRRKTTAAGAVWICPTFNSRGDVIGSFDAIDSKITAVRVENDNILVQM